MSSNEFPVRFQLVLNKKSTHVEEQAIDYTKLGRYLSVARIAQEEGGGSHGWKAALNYIMRAIDMGAPFVKRCELTKAMKFLYIVEGVNELPM